MPLRGACCGPVIFTLARMTQASGEAPYTKEWARLKRLQRAANWATFGFLPAVALIGVGVGHLLQIEMLFPIVGIAGLIAVFITDQRVMAFCCPRCGKPFFRGKWFFNGFAKKCVHCGLPKWGQ